MSTSIYLTSLILTLYFAMGLQSAILTPIAACAQVKPPYLGECSLNRLSSFRLSLLFGLLFHIFLVDRLGWGGFSIVAVVLNFFCFFAGSWPKCALVSAEVQWIRIYLCELQNVLRVRNGDVYPKFVVLGWCDMLRWINCDLHGLNKNFQN